MEYDRQLFVILGHFLLFYPTVDPKNMTLKYEAWQTEFCVILGYFLPFYPTTTQKIKILKK